MRKFVVQSKRGVTSIIEVEIEILSALDDPSIMWLPTGEYRARILKPESFHLQIEHIVDGKKEFFMVPDVWHSHAFIPSLEEAQKYSEHLIRYDFEFSLKKYKKEYSEEDVQEKISKIKTILL